MNKYYKKSTIYDIDCYPSISIINDIENVHIILNISIDWQYK